MLEGRGAKVEERLRKVRRKRKLKTAFVEGKGWEGRGKIEKEETARQLWKQTRRELSQSSCCCKSGDDVWVMNIRSSYIASITPAFHE